MAKEPNIFRQEKDMGLIAEVVYLVKNPFTQKVYRYPTLMDARAIAKFWYGYTKVAKAPRA